jgi:DNA-binding transcriptional LysR family regulator
MKASDSIAAWRLVRACASAGSLSVAASAEGLDLAAASRLIARLEEELGVTLLDRSRRPARPTETMAALASSAASLLRAQRDIRRTAERFASRSAPALRRIRVSLPINWCRDAVLTALRRFEERNPGLRFDYVADMAFPGILEGSVDIACVSWVPEEPGVFSLRISNDIPVMLASAAYIRHFGAPQSVEELAAREIWLRTASNRSSCRLLESGRERFRLPDGPNLHYADADACRRAVLLGYGIGIDLTFGLMAEAIVSGAVQPVLPQWHRRPWQRTVICPARLSSDPLVRGAMQAIRSATLQSFIDDWPFWYRRLGLPRPEQDLPREVPGDGKAGASPRG